MGRYLNSGTSHGTHGEPQTTLEQSKYASHIKELSSTSSYTLPENKSQLSHIFSNRKGHLIDTPYNRSLVLKTANNPKNYVGTDELGNQWYNYIQKDGSQIWVKVRKKKIDNAGKNNPPRIWDPDTGFNTNPKRNSTWRQKK